MSFPRRSARTVDTPSPRRRRWWGTSVALALVLAGCAAPQGDEGTAAGSSGATDAAVSSPASADGSEASSSQGRSSDAASSPAAASSGGGSPSAAADPADPALALAARSHEGVPMRAFTAEERPPQFVLFSFDGGRQDARWKTFLDAAADSDAKFTVFQSAINLIETANRENYTAPGNEPGYVGTEFGGDEAEVAQRIENINTAHAAGHEIGTHYAGHLCAPTRYGADHWSTAEWKQEYGSFTDILSDPGAYNPGSSLPALEVTPTTSRADVCPASTGSGTSSSRCGRTTDSSTTRRAPRPPPASPGPTRRTGSGSSRCR